MLDKSRILGSVVLDGVAIRNGGIHRNFNDDVFRILSAMVFAAKVPYYDRPEFLELYERDAFYSLLTGYILNVIKSVNEPFELDFKEIGADYIMTLQRPPGPPANLCRKIIEPLQPGDRWIILDISAISQYFVTTTTGIPAFINLVHEEVLVWMFRNMNTSSAHMEFIINTLQTKVMDDFDRNAYPYDNAVMDLLTSSFSCVLLMMIDLLQRFNLFDERGRSFWYVSELNKYEVILYDSRCRGAIP